MAITRADRIRMLDHHRARAADHSIPDALRRFHREASRAIHAELALPGKLQKKLRQGWDWWLFLRVWRIRAQISAPGVLTPRGRRSLT